MNNKTAKKPSFVIILRHRGQTERFMKDKDFEESTAREKAVICDLEELSKGKLKAKVTGYGAGISKKFDKPIAHDPNRPHEFDLLVSGVAYIEVTGSPTYSLDGSIEGTRKSGFFPITKDKIERALKSDKPCYFVFVLDKETQPNKSWIHSKDCAEYELDLDFETRYGRQETYKTDQTKWTRGLQSLVEEILRLERER